MKFGKGWLRSVEVLWEVIIINTHGVDVRDVNWRFTYELFFSF